MPTDKRDIRATIHRLERELVQLELDERGNIEFLWNGVKAVAVPIERAGCRSMGENYWRAQVGCKHIEFRSTDQREGVDTAWDVYTIACDAHRSAHGSSPQEVADQMCGMLTGFREELGGFFEGERLAEQAR